jgi:hypothetical protein
VENVTIKRMHMRYRLPARAADGLLRARLTAVQSLLLDEALAAALEQAGARPEEEICVRRLRVPVRLRGVRGDAALAADWAQAIAAALTETLARDGPEQAVRYGSRMHAWIDCALGVARGDLGRAWAWRRLGLWRAAGDLAPADGAAELVRGLAFAPDAVVPVLLGLAEQGALSPLARRLDLPSWTLLAAAALDAHAAPRELLERPAPPDGAVPATAPGATAAPTALTHAEAPGGPTATAPWDDSPLLPLREVAAPGNARALAVLILLAADPALGRRGLPGAGRQVDGLVQDLLDAASADPGRSERPATPRVQGPDSPGSPAAADRPRPTADPAPTPATTDPRGSEPNPGPVGGEPPVPAADDAATPAAPSGARPEERHAHAEPAAARPPSGPDPWREKADRSRGTNQTLPGTGPAGAARPPDPGSTPAEPAPGSGLRQATPTRPTEPVAGDDPRAASAPGREPDREPDRQPASPLVLRREGRTDWGGLLLLLNVLEPAGLLDPQAPLPPGRTLRWTLHHLAQALAPVTADDPAALAFAGLAPGTRPPSLHGPAASGPECYAIAELRARVVRCLHRVLEADTEHPEAVLTRICRRPAMILADPGWIEVRFALASLSTQLRRARLDLNPNWLPWLGTVVRFSYE